MDRYKIKKNIIQKLHNMEPDDAQIHYPSLTQIPRPLHKIRHTG
uniref:Uncharacterized protein MANES_03G166800 n=1 Tax=Rhizophora mucronata TaxID=61149 RepID=A0A2P2JFB7_RHIMU